MTQERELTYGIVVPVLNGGEIWRSCVRALCAQVPQPVHILVVDSGSTDGSDELSLQAGFDVVRIDKREFDHGGTRKMAAERLGKQDVVVFLTQDAVLASTDAIKKLVAAFDDTRVSVAYGRQLPRVGAGPFEAHARHFNYPAKSDVRVLESRRSLGIKAAFSSNSFAAYRSEALAAVGGFPSKLILAEDMVVTARMLLAGGKSAYVADARVYHSHDYTALQEFHRYFDIGVLHRDQSWLLDTFGRPEGEGIRFVRSEMQYLLKHAPRLLPVALLRNAMKFLGYKLGKYSPMLPQSINRRLSMHSAYWGGCG